jgi:hypothetical protein
MPLFRRLGFSFLACLLACSCLAQRAQQPQFADAAEISRDMLYQPANSIEPSAGAVLFRAPRFTYRFDSAAQTWQVTSENNFPGESPPTITVKSFTAANGTLYRFTASGDEKAAFLDIREGPAPPTNAPRESEPLARVALWTLEDLQRIWSRRLVEEAAEPEVSGVPKKGPSFGSRFGFTPGKAGAAPAHLCASTRQQRKPKPCSHERSNALP